MNTQNRHSSTTTFGRRIRISCKEKTQLEIKLVVCLIVVVLIFIGFLLYVIIQRAVSPKICHTPGCIAAASQIISHVDPSVDPCDDFFQFACGKFIQQSHGDIKASSISRLEEEVERQLVEIIKEPTRDDENDWIKSEKALFEACMNETEVVARESLTVFEEALVELGGWPVVMGYQWKEELFDWKEEIFKIRDQGYYASMMLNVEITSDVVNDNRNIVKLTLPYVEKIDSKYKQLYRKFITDVAVIFGAERNRAVNEMEKVLELMESLQNINQLDRETDGDTQALYNETAALLATRFSIQKFQNINGDIDWLEYINNHLQPAGKISVYDYALFPKINTTEAFFKLIYKTQKRTLGNYIIWKLIETVLQFMPKELKQCQANYRCLTNQRALEKDRLKFCRKIVERSFCRTPSEIMYARRYVPVATRNKVKDLVDQVGAEFLTALDNASWMDNESRKKALEKAKATTKIIGASGDYFHDSVFYLHAPHGNYHSKNESFFKRLLDHRKIGLASYYSKIRRNSSQTILEDCYSYFTSVGAYYVKESNTILLPAGVLQGVFYSPDRPMYLNYGILGSTIGHEFTHGFCEAGSKYHKDGYKTEMWTNETKQAYQNKIECIVKEADEYITDEKPEAKMNATLTLEENVADYTGLKVSYAAYKNWVRRHGKEPQLPEIIYSPEQLFWISAVAYECFSPNVSRFANDEMHAHNKFRVNAPLRNNLDFAKDFNCPVGSKMNPAQKCQVF